MALINCPECGNQVSDAAISCPHCGYGISSSSSPVQSTDKHKFKESNLYIKTNIFISEHRKAVGIAMMVLAVLLFIIAISKFNDRDYKDAVDNLSYYKSQYNECMSNAYGLFGSSYKAIADRWDAMIGELNYTIWSTRIISFLLFAIDIPLIIFGIKNIKLSKKEKKEDGFDQLP